VFTIRSYMRRQPATPARARALQVVAEILDPENAGHARTAGSDEVIETTRVGFSLLSHALVMPGTAEAIVDVASFGELSLYIGRHDRDEPSAFGALAQRLKREHGVLLIGVRAADGRSQRLNPPDELVVDRGHHVLHLGDRAVLPLP
jgi:hypothetical protein